MWVLEQIISEICTAYEQLPGGRQPLPKTDDERPLLGNLEKFKNDHHRVIWTLTGGSFDKATKIGGPEGTHYLAVCTFQVWIWQPTLELCWAVMVDLLAAIRTTIYGPNMGALNFQAPTETEGRHQHDGELLTFSVNIAVPVPIVGSVPVTTVPLETHQSNVTLDNGELIDGAYEPFETVIVVGPIDES